MAGKNSELEGFVVSIQMRCAKSILMYKIQKWPQRPLPFARTNVDHTYYHYHLRHTATDLTQPEPKGKFLKEVLHGAVNSFHLRSLLDFSKIKLVVYNAALRLVELLLGYGELNGCF